MPAVDVGLPGSSHSLPDTRPIADDDLLADQKTLLNNVQQLLTAMADEAADGVVATPHHTKPWPWRPDADRRHRVILIDGPRGSGKTSLLLTLIDSWCEALLGRQPKWLAPTATAAVAKGNKPQWGWIQPLDFDPLPPHIHPFAWLVYGLRPLVEAVRDAKCGKASGAETPPESLMQAWRDLYQGALISWDGDYDRKRMNDDLEDFVVESEERQRGWQHLRVKWRALVDCLLSALERSELRWPANGLLIVPIDDLDLHPSRAPELLQAMRLCWHPRVVFLLTGDRKHLYDVMVDKELGRQRLLAAAGSADPHGRGRVQSEYAHELAQSAVDKVVPQPQVFSTALVRLHEWLRIQGRPGVASYSTPAQALASWPADALPGLRRVFVATYGEHPTWPTGEAGSVGFLLRNLVHSTAAPAGRLHDALPNLVASLYQGRNRLNNADDSSDLGDTAQLSQVFAFSADAVASDFAGYQPTTRVRFLRTVAGAQTAVPAEPEAVLYAELAATGKVSGRRLGWDGTMPVPSVLAYTKVPSGILVVSWPEILARQPSALLGIIGDAGGDGVTAVKGKRPAKKLAPTQHRSTALSLWNRVRGWAYGAVEAQRPGTSIPATALFMEAAVERQNLEEALWFGTPESGLSADDRHLALRGAGLRANLRSALDSALSRATKARRDRLLAAQRVGRLVPELRDRPWVALDVDSLIAELDRVDAEAEGPWRLRDILTRPNWLDWTTPADNPLRLDYLVNVGYYAATGNGHRNLISLFSDGPSGDAKPWQATVALVQPFLAANAQSRALLWSWLDNVQTLAQFGKGQQSAAVVLKGLWDASAPLLGASAEWLTLSPAGDLLLWEGPVGQVRAPSRAQDDPAGWLGLYTVEGWRLFGADKDETDPPWLILGLAGAQLAFDRGNKSFGLECQNFELVGPLAGGEGSSLTVPTREIGWLAAERIRVRWNELTNSIPIEDVRSQESVRRWAIANALHSIHSYWFATDGGTRSVGGLPYPVLPVDFERQAASCIDKYPSKDARACWFAELDLANLLDRESYAAWERGAARQREALTAPLSPPAGEPPAPIPDSLPADSPKK